MARPELRMSFSDAEALGREFESNLRLGRAFLPGARSVEVLSDCTLVLVHPTDASELALPAQVVMVSDSASFSGAGLELRPFDASTRERIAGWLAETHEPPAAPETEAVSESASETESVSESEAASVSESEAASVSESEAASVSEAVSDAETESESEAESVSEAVSDAESVSEPESESVSDAVSDAESETEAVDETDLQAQAALMDRMRALSQVERQKIARRGELQERVLLERLYEKEVWGLLLRNPRITLPEIARIARKRSVPRNLLEQIVDNAAWVQASLVRRALLGNPRVGPDSIQKLIRATPKHELKLLAKSTSYSIAVRDAARKALKPSV